MTYQTQEIIKKGGFAFQGEIPPPPHLNEDLATGASAALITRPLEVEFEISVGSKELLLLGTVKGCLKYKCSRCNDEFEAAFNQELEETYPLVCETVDAGEHIRQAVLLVLPEKPLCRPDCRGLCPICGANRNAKSCECRDGQPAPFAKLKDILKEKDK